MEDGKDHWMGLFADHVRSEDDNSTLHDGDSKDAPSIVHDVFGVNDADWKHFSSRQLCHACAIASADLPAPDHCREIERLQRHGDAGEVPLNLGAPLAAPTQADRAWNTRCSGTA
jgi:hypothetical protein